MSVRLLVDGYLGKDPYVQTLTDKKVVVLSIASRRGHSRHADWITGTVWDKRLQDFVLGQFHKGDKVQVGGIMGKLAVYHSDGGKARPSLDMFINTIGFATRETADVEETLDLEALSPRV